MTPQSLSSLHRHGRGSWFPRPQGIAVHRDHDIIVWIDKDELAKDPGSHVRAAALKPPLVAVACIAF